jgi:hypothetical protein
VIPPLEKRAATPIAWSKETTQALPATFSEMACKGRVRDAVAARWLRPADLSRAEIGVAERIWLPVWRIEGAVDGFHLGLRATQGRGRAAVLPTGGFSHHDGDLLVPARRAFTIELSERARIARGDLRRFSEVAPPEEECIEPDVDRAAAEEEATLRLRRRGEPRQALYASVDVKIRSAELCFQPLWVVRYLYAGEASEGKESTYHAAISGHSGELLSERHPPLLGSVLSRIKAWL